METSGEMDDQASPKSAQSAKPAPSSRIQKRNARQKLNNANRALIVSHANLGKNSSYKEVDYWKSVLIDLKNLFIIFGITFLFYKYHHALDQERKLSDYYALLEITGKTAGIPSGKKLNLSDQKIKKRMDNMGFGNFLSVDEVFGSNYSAIEKWRQPKDDFMYSQFINYVEKKNKIYGNKKLQFLQLELKSKKLDILCSKADTNVTQFHTCSAASFTSFKRIRQILFEMQKQCTSARNRQNFCSHSATQASINEIYQKNFNQLFPNELCYCRHGKTKKLPTFKSYQQQCSYQASFHDRELCKGCYGNKGYTFNNDDDHRVIWLTLYSGLTT